LTDVDPAVSGSSVKETVVAASGVLNGEGLDDASSARTS